MQRSVDRQTVINCLAVSGIVEEIIRNVAGDSDENLKDLAQDIYIYLLSKDEDKLVYMFENKQIKYYITKIITNQIYSNSSPFYCTYKKDKNNKKNIDDYENKL